MIQRGTSSFIPDTDQVNALYPSPNINERRGVRAPSMLILHYTGLLTVQRSLEVLSDPACQVSCHYVIDEAGAITQMVPEAMRAWHAGVSSWHNETDLNSRSIGIEIQNLGHAHGYPDFPDVQMASVVRLAQDIIARHDIVPEHVLAHSDIAPQRKDDPGEKFNWQQLWEAGVGHWVAPEPVAATPAGNPTVAEMQSLLQRYGYACPQHGELDGETAKVVIAFQRHFRPEKVDGKIDYSTVATLKRLLSALPAHA
ncbi:MAG: N-acetylmuramoyl-L-alanine amidase [Pseudomonadota bacterium]